MTYPLGTEQPFPKNRWYIAAFARDLKDKPMQRLILDTPVALYRTREGKAVAMYGLCPHRYFPLGEGKVDGDALVCGYHGFACSDLDKLLFSLFILISFNNRF